MLLTLAIGFFSLFPPLSAAPLQAPKWSTPPLLDGKLDDAVWESALKFDQFILVGTDRLGLPTTALLAYDESSVYVGMHCKMPPGTTLEVPPPRPDATVFADECVEVMIDANRTGDRYFHFVLNAGGMLFDSQRVEGGHVGIHAWNSDAEGASFRGGDYWSCELKIPMHSLDLQSSGTTWGFNFARTGKNMANEASVLPLGAYHNAGAFLAVDGFDLDYSKYAWTFACPEIAAAKQDGVLLLNITVPVSNLLDRQAGTLLEVTLCGEDSDEAASVSCPIQLEAYETRVFPIQGITLTHPGKFHCTVSIRDSFNRRLYKRQTWQQTINAAAFTITLLEPAYRNAIFASQKLEDVVYTIKSTLPAETLHTAQVITGIRDASGKILCSSAATFPSRVTFKAAPLPDGALTIFIDGGALGKAECPLRKLPFREGEVWRDKHGIWHVEETPFWIILSWGGNFDIPGINVKISHSAPPHVLRVAHGVAFSDFRARVDMRKTFLTTDELNYTRKVAEKMLQTENLFGYFLADEPAGRREAPEALRAVANILREVDPYHPIFISNNSISGMHSYADAAELNFINSFPAPLKTVPRNNFGRIVVFMREALAANRNRLSGQSIAHCAQGFNYGDLGAQSKVPTWDEFRTQHILALAMGINFTSFYSEKKAAHYPEVTVSHCEFAKEVNILIPALLTNDMDEAQCSNPTIALRVKKVDGEFWIFAASTVLEPQNAEFTIVGLGNRELRTLREPGRTLRAANGSFSDGFNNYDARVYTTDMRDLGLRSNDEVEKEIAARNDARRKPGNLAYQQCEYDTLSASASSNRFDMRRSDTCIWHVTDGVTTGDPANYFWLDKTPNTLPDWLALKFHQPVKASRIIVYPHASTLRDYEVQIRKDGQWESVAAVKDAQGEFQEFKFPPVSTDEFRIYITATNGPDSGINEIEIYEE
jgi:hypothetical protein